MHRIKFHSKEDLSAGYYLKKCEEILRADIKPTYDNINDVMELYNIQLYIDAKLYLNNWTSQDIVQFEQKVNVFKKIIGRFLSNINDSNINEYCKDLSFEYNNSFWHLIDNRNTYKQFSKTKFIEILALKPSLIHLILTNKNLVDYYKTELKNFLLNYKKSAEILLSVYSVKNDILKKKKYVPKNLTIVDKENILSNYVDSEDTNLNYLELIENVKNENDFKLSDKTRLKAKRLFNHKKKELFAKSTAFKYGVNVSFERNLTNIKDAFTDNENIIHYKYSTDFIEDNENPHTLLKNFKYLFEYIDEQNRIALVSKARHISTIEGIFGIEPKQQYKTRISFTLLESTSLAQINGYSNVLDKLEITIEGILQSVFSKFFQEEYNFDSKATISIPNATSSYLEKIRFLTPELESILKQFKLFVEDGTIDFDLIRISSSPTSIKDIPSLNSNKYIYLNEENKKLNYSLYLFFSDQSLLGYVELYQEKNYTSFFELLANENININVFEEYQKNDITYLINDGLLHVDEKGFIIISNFERLYILRDLYENEFASFYHYAEGFREEVLLMVTENLVFFVSSLFSKQEQSYFNYYLNKSEFTNGKDLRNKYVHGSQADPSDLNEHAYAYFTYLKLFVLTLLKIDDDLKIWKLNTLN